MIWVTGRQCLLTKHLTTQQQHYNHTWKNGNHPTTYLVLPSEQELKGVQMNHHWQRTKITLSLIESIHSYITVVTLGVWHQLDKWNTSSYHRSALLQTLSCSLMPMTVTILFALFKTQTTLDLHIEHVANNFTSITSGELPKTPEIKRKTQRLLFHTPTLQTRPSNYSQNTQWL